jgi:hypothetical protein
MCPTELTGSSAPRRKHRLGIRNAMHLRSAEYWLALGEIHEALLEIEKIQRCLRKHPEVIQVAQKIKTEARLIEEEVILEPYWDRE